MSQNYQKREEEREKELKTRLREMEVQINQKQINQENQRRMKRTLKIQVPLKTLHQRKQNLKVGKKKNY